MEKKEKKNIFKALVHSNLYINVDRTTYQMNQTTSQAIKTG